MKVNASALDGKIQEVRREHFAIQMESFQSG
jgi:hypothetical protein